MSNIEVDQPSLPVVGADRRASVLESALVTFARFGYRKTSMEAVARAAGISRPGLYFLFSSKEALFAAAVTQTLEHDLAEVERLLTRADEPLRQRLRQAFDQWAGRYVGPLSREITAVIADNPDVLGSIVHTAPRRFEGLVTDAVSLDLGPQVADGVAQTLISTSIGIKHQVDARAAYLDRLAVAIDLLVPTAT